MASIIPTQEQHAVIQHASRMQPEDTLLITAFAGAAKTSTLEMIASALPGKEFLYLAFNKAIVEEAKRRFPRNVTIKTTHSLAYQHTPRQLRLRQNNYRAADVAELYGIDYEKAWQVLSVFEFYCNSALTDFSQIAVDDEIKELAKDFYGQMRSAWIEMTHSFYLKEFQLSLFNGLKIRQSYDYCLLDEAQDTNPVTLSIFKFLPGRKIKVGDSHQMVYGFRGAVNGMGENSAKSPSRGLVRMNLTTTFRCRPHIVDQANWILGTFKGETAQIVSGNTSNGEIKTEAYITRTNSALIEYVDMLPAFNLTRTPDLIFECLLSLVNWKYCAYGSIAKSFKFLTQFKSRTELDEYVEQADDQEIKRGLKLLDKYDGSEVWANEGLRNGDKIRQLYQKAVVNYARNGQSSITLTTAHSSKGLEFDRVLLGDDFPDLVEVISKLIKEKIISEPADFLKGKKAEIVSAREEVNLYYVAITRAKYNLVDNTPSYELYEMKLPLAQVFALARQAV